MPLIIVTGFPSSGKTTTADALHKYLAEEKGKKVVRVTEDERVKGAKERVYSHAAEEKRVRGEIKSEAVRKIHRDDVLILDGLNYIKGFRYELYCASKAAKTTQCTVHCDVSAEDAWGWNVGRPDEGERYSKDTFDALVARYEAPVGANRWDAPLFLSLASRPVDAEAVYDALFSRKPPPPNQSTQCQPLSSTSFLYELDRTTKEIVTAVLEAQRSGLAVEGDDVTVPGTEERFRLRSRVTMAQLARQKRQFIVYAKARAVDDVARLATMFVQYLNAAQEGQDADEL